MAHSNVFPRDGRRELPVAAGGDGVYIVAADGKRYLDACGGAAVSCLGHSNREVIDAAVRQLNGVAYAHTGFFTSAAAEELAAKLVSLAPEGLQRAYFTGKAPNRYLSRPFVLPQGWEIKSSGWFGV